MSYEVVCTCHQYTFFTSFNQGFEHVRHTIVEQPICTVFVCGFVEAFEFGNRDIAKQYHGTF